MKSEIEEPVQYSGFKRRLLLALVSLGGLLAPLASTVYFPAMTNITNDLKTTTLLMNVTISVFMLVLAIFPLVWGVLADEYGRRWIFILSIIVLIGSSIGAALTPNVEMLIAMRMLQGIGSSAPLVAGVGVVSDMYPQEELGMPVSIFFSGTLIGPILGPILGGFIDSYFGWRAIFWFLAIVGGLLLILVVLFLPETLKLCRPFPYKLTISPPRIQKVGRLPSPLASLVFLRFPVVVLAGLIPALAFGTFFGVESFHSIAMERTYRLDSTMTGFSFVVLGVGSLVGNFVGGKLTDVMSQRSHPSNLESRLNGVWAFIIILVLGFLGYGWSLDYKLGIWAPLTASFFIGLGYASCFSGASAYLVNLSPESSSSISSSANFLRMIFATIITTLNPKIIDTLGYGFGATLFAGLASLAILIILILIAKGGSLRSTTGPFPSE